MYSIALTRSFARLYRRGLCALVLSLFLMASSSLITHEAMAQEICYSVADNDDDPGSPDLLVTVNRNTGAETSIGSLGTANVEAIAYSPFADRLYATNAGQFGEINTSTGVFTTIGSGFGTGDGVLGSVTFSDVDGLHYDPFPGPLYGVHRRGNGDDGNNDVMFEIDITTGNFVAGAFPDFDGDGNDDDYLEIRSGQAVDRWDIDDLAIDPATGIMYGAANNGGTNDELVEINRNDGSVTLVGNMGVFDIEGLSFDTDGDLFGSSGTSGTPANSLFDINKSTGVATLIANLSDGNDYEALACLTDGRNTITGRVYYDSDFDAIRDPGETGEAGITVRLFRDDNGNGVVDSGEPQVATKFTDSLGDYIFEIAGTGDFVVMVFSSDLPSGTVFTTDDVETASFPAGSYGNVDSGNDFGYATHACTAFTIDRRVGASTDDAEERSSSVSLSSSDIELVFDGSTDQLIGLRFTNAAILPGATILTAYIQFTVDETDTGGVSLTIQGEDTDDADTFSSTAGDISGRTLTTASISWAPPGWTTVGESGSDQRTPDISWIIQEIVDRGGWSTGNDIAIIIDGTGERTSEAFDGVAASAALLHVEWAVIDSDGCGALPVELTRFDAVADGPDVLLAWDTASETNNAGFEVQHRVGGETEQAGELPWTALGWVEGYGTTEFTQTYSYRVEDLAPGRHVFRLKQIDFDGTFEYHPEVEVIVEMAERFVVESVYPNPFNPEAEFRFAVQRPQTVRVEMYDMLGRRVKALYAGEVSAGQMQIVRIDGQGLPSGLYVVRVVGETFVNAQTVTLLK